MGVVISIGADEVASDSILDVLVVALGMAVEDVLAGGDLLVLAEEGSAVDEQLDAFELSFEAADDSDAFGATSDKLAPTSSFTSSFEDDEVGCFTE